MATALDARPTGIRGNTLRTLLDCWLEFTRRGSFRVVLVFFCAALGLRLGLGRWSWRDLVAVAAVAAAQPFVEWLIHVYLLHCKPVRIGSRTHDFATARFHRRHHNDPDDLDYTLLPAAVATIFCVQIALGMAVVAIPIAWLTHGSWLLIATTCTLAGYAGLAVYEWIHFLIHTGYAPRSRAYAVVWRNHRLHHYKNEAYWFGITTNVGDIVLRTNPAQATVPKSPTARTLGVDVSLPAR